MTLFKGCPDCEALWSEYVTATDQYLRIKAATLRPEASPQVLLTLARTSELAGALCAEYADAIEKHRAAHSV